MYEAIKALKEMPEETFFREIYKANIDNELSKVVCGNITFLSSIQRKRLEAFVRRYGGDETTISNKEIVNTCRYITKRIFSVPRERNV